MDMIFFFVTKRRMDMKLMGLAAGLAAALAALAAPQDGRKLVWSD